MISSICFLSRIWTGSMRVAGTNGTISGMTTSGWLMCESTDFIIVTDFVIYIGKIIFYRICFKHSHDKAVSEAAGDREEIPFEEAAAAADTVPKPDLEIWECRRCCSSLLQRPSLTVPDLLLYPMRKNLLPLWIPWWCWYAVFCSDHKRRIWCKAL